MRDVPELTEINQKLNFHAIRLDALESESPVIPPVEPPIEPPVEPPITTRRLIGGNDGWWHKDWDPSNPFDESNRLIPSHVAYRRPFSAGIRGMNTLNVNNSDDVNLSIWSHDKIIELCRLCNALGCPLYYTSCFNHSQEANGEALSLIHQELDSVLPVYLEPANEIWNSGFFPYKWIKSTFGVELGHDVFFKEWTDRYERLCEPETTARLGTRIFYRVLAGQTANDWVTRKMHERVVTRPDCIAQTTYFRHGNWRSGMTDSEFVDEVKRTYPGERDDILKHLRQTISWGLRPISYESNHHWHILGNNEAMRQFNRVQEFPEGIALVKRSLDDWFSNGGKEVFAYVMLALNDQNNSFGISGDTLDLTERYKFWANYVPTLS